MSEKKVTLRKCVGCGQMKDKNTLLRIVRDSDGNISPDTSGKKPGRGAYICRDKTCFLAAKKARRLEKAFSSRISEETYVTLSDCFS